MKELTKKFLTQQERERIIETVRKVEKITVGELVPMVVSSSYHYPLSDVVGGFTLSLPIAVLLARFAGPHLGFGVDNMWFYMSAQLLLFLVCYFVVKNVLWLKRLFISREEIEEEVREAAITGFYQNGLHCTREATGILFFISVFERKVWVLADKGINSKVKEGAWDEIIAIIVKGIKEGTQCDAICEAVLQAGAVLQAHFPRKFDDRDELQNLIIK